MGAETVTKARQKRKADLVYIMGGKCSICGYDKCQQALEFHHIDKSTKKFGLSSGNCHSWEEDIQEVKNVLWYVVIVTRNWKFLIIKHLILLMKNDTKN